MTDDTTDETESESETTYELHSRDLAAFANTLVQRSNIASAMGQSFGDLDGRDYFDTLGYPSDEELGVDDYRAQFERGGIAETIVTAVSGQTWSEAPTVTDDDSPDDEDNETSFEADVETLFDETGLLHYLERADTLQRIGRFGILLIGFDDGADSLEDPVDEAALTGKPADDILYYQPFGEDSIEEIDRVEDPFDERFGLVESYEVDFGDDHPEGIADVHHSRVLHIAEGALEDEIIGYSAYRPIYNYLVDLLRVVGGSSEMFWRDAKSRFVANLDPEVGGVDEDKLATQVEEMVNDLRDVAWGRGLELEKLEGGSPDPSGVKDAVIELIAGQTRIPKRKLLGTERGDLASTQDEAQFVALIEERRQKFGEPQMLRPLLDHLEDLGVIASPADESYEIEWPDLFELNEIERAEVMQRKAKAYKDAASMGDPAELATTAERRDDIFGLEPERGAEVDVDPGDVVDDIPDPDTPDNPDDGDGDTPDDTDTDVDDVGEGLDEDDVDVEEWFEEHFERRRAGATAPSDD